MPERPTLYLFTGVNTYALRAEKRQWKEQFVSKHGEENFLSLSGSHLTFQQLADEVGSAPFIAEKRLVVVDGVPKFSKEDMESLPSVMHPNTVLVFADAQPDKRLGGTKVLLKIATVKDHPALPRSQLHLWIVEYLRARGASLDAAGEELLLSLVGEDQDVLSSELQKLASSTNAKSLTAADVRMLCVPWGEQEIWELTRLIAAKDRRAALQFASAMLRQGEDAHSLWNMLLWMTRNLVIVALAHQQKGRSVPDLTKMGVPFPTLRTLTPAVSGSTREGIRELVEWAVQADIALKTGGWKATSDATEELVALIEQLITRMITAIEPATVAR